MCDKDGLAGFFGHVVGVGWLANLASKLLRTGAKFAKNDRLQRAIH